MGRSSRPRPCASGLGRNAPGAQQAKQEEADASDEAFDARRRAAAYCGTLEQDKELLAIFERTYGPIKRRGEAAGQHDQLAARKAFRSVGPSQNRTPAAPPPSGPEYLLVDGYNVIFAWDELKEDRGGKPGCRPPPVDGHSVQLCGLPQVCAHPGV